MQTSCPLCCQFLCLIFFVQTPKKLVKLPSSSNASKVTGPKAGPDQIDGKTNEKLWLPFSEKSVYEFLVSMIDNYSHGHA